MKPILTAFLTSIVVACAAEVVEPVADDAPQKKARTVEKRTAAPEPASMPAAPRPNLGVNQLSRLAPRPDRCLVENCGDTSLLEQPELEFIEDMGDGWKRLMEMDWEVGPGSEGYRCMTLTVPEAIYITEFSPQVPRGTHHTTFGVNAVPIGPDAITTCGVGTIGERLLQAGGPGAEPSALPPGVAMPLRRGVQLHMNLHLFNLGDQPLRGRSGMWVRTVPASEIEQVAENVVVGPLELYIPLGRSTQRGVCTLRADATIHTVGPHMHQTGIHMRGTAETKQGEILLYDGDYSFDHQLVYDVGPFELKAGDRVHVECTYLNTTDAPLRWGDSALDEMCFLGLVLYPAIEYGADPCSY